MNRGCLAVLLWVGCSVPPADAGPAEAVDAVFGAIARADCTRLEALLTGSARRRLEGGDCAQRLQEMRGVGLHSIGAVRIDGRDRERRLVETRLRTPSGTRDVMIGVRLDDGTWHVDHL